MSVSVYNDIHVFTRPYELLQHEKIVNPEQLKALILSTCTNELVTQFSGYSSMCSAIRPVTVTTNHQMQAWIDIEAVSEMHLISVEKNGAKWNDFVKECASGEDMCILPHLEIHEKTFCLF